MVEGLVCIGLCCYKEWFDDVGDCFVVVLSGVIGYWMVEDDVLLYILYGDMVIVILIYCMLFKYFW